MTNTIAQFVDTTVYGGAEAVAVDLCGELNKAGYQTLIYHFGSPDLERRSESRGVEHRRLDEWAAYKHWKSLPTFGKRFAERLRRENVSLLHSHLYGSILGGTLASVFSRVPHVGTLHDFYTLEEHTAFRVRSLQASAGLGTRLVTVARTLEAFCRKNAWFPGSRLRTIYNGIRLNGAEVEERAAVRSGLGIGEQEIVFISVGRMVPLKRQDLLIEAFGKMRGDLPVRLLLVGEGPERARLEALTDKLGVRARVHFLGFRSDVHSFLAASDCFALVSTTECLSCSVLEAMSHSLPIVATRVGGNGELVEEGVNGRFVEPEAGALSRLFTELASNSEALSRLGNRSEELYQDQFLVDKMVAQYRRLYGELLGER